MQGIASLNVHSRCAAFKHVEQIEIVKNYECETKRNIRGQLRNFLCFDCGSKRKSAPETNNSPITPSCAFFLFCFVSRIKFTLNAICPPRKFWENPNLLVEHISTPSPHPSLSLTNSKVWVSAAGTVFIVCLVILMLTSPLSTARELGNATWFTHLFGHPMIFIYLFFFPFPWEKYYFENRKC